MGWNVDEAGLEALRTLFALMIGLGMREYAISFLPLEFLDITLAVKAT